MKKCLVRCLILGAFLFMMAGAPLQLFHVDSVGSAYAMGWLGDRNHAGGGGGTYNTPEPGTLSMLLVGIAGVGTYLTIRRVRKGRKK
jgi:hypothetical protein